MVEYDVHVTQENLEATANAVVTRAQCECISTYHYLLLENLREGKNASYVSTRTGDPKFSFEFDRIEVDAVETSSMGWWSTQSSVKMKSTASNTPPIAPLPTPQKAATPRKAPTPQKAPSPRKSATPRKSPYPQKALAPQKAPTPSTAPAPPQAPPHIIAPQIDATHTTAPAPQKAATPKKAATHRKAASSRKAPASKKAATPKKAAISRKAPVPRKAATPRKISTSPSHTPSTTDLDQLADQTVSLVDAIPTPPKSPPASPRRAVAPKKHPVPKTSLQHEPVPSSSRKRSGDEPESLPPKKKLKGEEMQFGEICPTCNKHIVKDKVLRYIEHFPLDKAHFTTVDKFARKCVITKKENNETFIHCQFNSPGTIQKIE